MKTLIALHRWTGAAVAVILLIASVSGGLLLWSDEYQQWQLPQAQLPEFEVRPSTIAAIVGAEGRRPTAIGMPQTGSTVYHVYYPGGPQALFDAHFGERIQQWEPGDTLVSFLFEVHVRLFSGETGHTIVGVTGILLCVMALTGIWIWWPRRKRMPVRNLLPKRTSNLSLIKAHAANGVVWGTFALFLGFSGAAIVFHGPAQGALNALLGESGPTRPTVTPVLNAYSENIHWDSVLTASSLAFPDGELRFIFPPQNAGEPVTLRIRGGSELHPNGRSYLVVHPQTGEVLETIDASTTGLGPTVFNALYPLHSGKTGWPGHRLILVLAAVALIYMSVSGLWVFLRRRRKRKPGHLLQPFG